MTKRFSVKGSWRLLMPVAVVLFFSCHREDRKVVWPNFKPIEAFFLARQGADGASFSRNYLDALHNLSLLPTLRSLPYGFNGNWVSRGPSSIGARVNVIQRHPVDSLTFYLGFSSGGLWRTDNGGKSWVSIFDDYPYLAIADIQIDPRNPKILYVATGDPNISGYPFVGDGIYKSIDGGQHWINIGPAGIQVISKVLVHPLRSDILFAASMGLPFNRDRLRGIYRSLNGGQTWEKILHAADDTGFIDLLVDPFNPETLFAASWPRVRNNRESLLTGPMAGIWKTSDGGTTWRQVNQGLKPVVRGRIGLVASKRTPGLLYAISMGENSEWEGVYRSTNGAEFWSSALYDESTQPLPSNAMGAFGWYFGKIEVNPFQDQDVFVLGVDLWRSRDGGKNWKLSAPAWYESIVHADKHDLVFLNQREWLLATDGGVYITRDEGNTWSDFEQIPTTQFYRIAINPHVTDRFYGGAQDHGTLQGNLQDNWSRLYGGDGFQQVFHPGNPKVMYTLSQNGNIQVSTNEGLSFDNATKGIDRSEPVAWDAPLSMSPFNPDILYTGTSRIYQNTSGTNVSWKPISPVLTDANVFGARFHNITAVKESPLQKGLLYVGTSDANCWRYDVQTTTWTNISAGLPDRFVTGVFPSPHFPNDVFVTLSGYRDNDMQSYIFYSRDLGKTWISLRGDLPMLAINDLLIIPNRGDSILFAATDGGVYGSINGGKQWSRLGLNLPNVAVYNLAYQAARQELVAGTFGRSLHTYSLKAILEGGIILTRNPAVLQINADGDPVSMDIQSNTRWTLINQTSFLSPSAISGIGNSRVFIRANRNESLASRSGRLVLRGEGSNDSLLVSVTQAGAKPYFTLNPDKFQFKSEGGSQWLDLQSNTSWRVLDTSVFLSPGISLGMGQARLSITCAPNPDFQPREGYLKIAAEGVGTLTIFVSQAARKAQGTQTGRMSAISFRIFPNPIQGEYLYLRRAGFWDTTPVKGAVYDAQGRIVSFFDMPGYQDEIRLSSLSWQPGIYYLTLRDLQGTWIFSDILKR